MNGLAFNLTGADAYEIARANSTQTGLTTAIYCAALQAPGGVEAVFADPKGFLNLTDQIYTLFLALISKRVYFTSADPTTSLNLRIAAYEERIVLAPWVVHVEAALLFVMGLLGIVVHIQHTKDRRLLVLPVSPSTIGATLSLAANSNVGDLLHNEATHNLHVETVNDEALREILSTKMFKFDEKTGQIVVDPDTQAPPPTPTTLPLLGKRLSTRGSGYKSVSAPTTPV